MPLFFHSKSIFYSTTVLNYSKLSLTLVNYSSFLLSRSCVHVLSIVTDGYSIENVNLLWNYEQPVIFGADDNNEQTMPQFYFYKELETFGCTTTNAFSKTRCQSLVLNRRGVVLSCVDCCLLLLSCFRLVFYGE